MDFRIYQFTFVHFCVLRKQVVRRYVVEFLLSGCEYFRVDHLAAKNNHCNVVIFLLNRGANPDIPDNKGNKPAIPFYATYHTPLIYGTTAMIGSLLAYAAYKTTTD